MPVIWSSNWAIFLAFIFIFLSRLCLILRILCIQYTMFGCTSWIVVMTIHISSSAKGHHSKFERQNRFEIRSRGKKCFFFCFLFGVCVSCNRLKLSSTFEMFWFESSITRFLILWLPGLMVSAYILVTFCTANNHNIPIDWNWNKMCRLYSFSGKSSQHSASYEAQMNEHIINWHNSFTYSIIQISHQKPLNMFHSILSHKSISMQSRKTNFIDESNWIQLNCEYQPRILLFSLAISRSPPHSFHFKFFK